MTELELIIDLHRNADRQGPGSERDTLRALGFLNLPTDRGLKVADLGCGSGGQTLTLAANINGQITAVDLFPEFLNQLKEKSEQLGLADKIVTLKRSMDDLPFSRNEYDLIWAEGSIYNVGFGKGIRMWKDFLKPGGFIAVTEITWLTHFRPKEIEQFWTRHYPEIGTALNKIKILEENNFTLEGYFNLSPHSWTDQYYKPLEARFETFLKRHRNSELARKVVDDHQAEIRLYRKYKDYYSYGFYIARKN